MVAEPSSERGAQKGASASPPEGRVTAGRMPATGLTRARRLTQKQEFDAVFRSNRSSRDAYFTVLARDSGLPEARLGMVVSKKVDRRAVGRNRVKRIVRESFRSQVQQLVGIDVVVIAKPEAARINNQTLFRSLDHHWNKIQLSGA